MANEELTQLDAQVQAALNLCDTDTADGLIGSPPPNDYGVLIHGIQAAYRLLWMMCGATRMKRNPNTLKMGGQALIIMSQMVHYAYALGIKEGMKRKP